MMHLTKFSTNPHYSLKGVFFTILFVFILFPVNSSFSAEFSDKEPTLAIVLTSFTPYHFQNEDGYTIVLGEVENTKDFPITGVQIRAQFYDEFDEDPIESSSGTTAFQVIPPFGKSPYIVKSQTPNSAITDVSVNVGSFDSAPEKELALEIQAEVSEITDRIQISGAVSNKGSQNSGKTTIHLFFYDAFERIRGFSSIQLNDVKSGSESDFEFDAKFNDRYMGFRILAESSDYYSEIFDNQLIGTKFVTISDFSTTDGDGNKLSDFTVGNTINIQNKISILYSTQESFEQEYVYYAQIKKSEIPFVEHIGIYEGTFQSNTETPTIEWIPEDKGLYFVETFVWDSKSIALASKGPVLLILVT